MALNIGQVALVIRDYLGYDLKRFKEYMSNHQCKVCEERGLGKVTVPWAVIKKMAIIAKLDRDYDAPEFADMKRWIVAHGF